MVFSQPLLELLAKQPPIFLTRGSPWSELLGVALGVLGCALAPGAIHAVTARLSSHLARRFFYACGFLLFAAAAVLILGKLVTAWVVFPIAILWAVFALRLYAGKEELRKTCLLLSVLTVLGGLGQGVYFLWFSPSARAIAPAPPSRYAALPKTTEVPIVLLVFDELPLTSLLTSDGAIDGKLFPNFQRLASTTTWYPKATAASDYTEYAVPPMLTGILPQPGKLGTLANYPDNLFTFLTGHYRTAALEAVTRLAPSSARVSLDAGRGSLFRDLCVLYGHRLLPRDLERLLPEVGHQWGNFGAEQPGDATRDEMFLRFVEQITAGEQPGFYFLHTILPHYPYLYQPSGKTYDSSGAVVAEGLNLDGPHGTHDVWAHSWAAQQAYQRHLVQLGYIDRLLGVMLDKLQATGIWDKCVFVLVADHGAAFIPQVPHRILQPSNSMDLAAVPLFVKLPGQNEGKIDDRQASTVDVAPTIAEAIGEPLPWNLDGHSLLGPPRTAGNFSMLRKADLKRFDFSYDTDWLNNTVALKERLFGKGAGLPGLYRLGPHPALLGRGVAELPQAKVAAGRCELAWPELLSNVKPEEKFQPDRIRGRLFGLTGAPGSLVPLAVAVNGVIRATTLAQLDGENTEFAVLLAEDTLRPGANVVDVYLIGRTAQGPTLIPLTAADRSYTLVRSAEQEVLKSATATIPVTGNGQGSVDELSTQGNEVFLRGWAGRTDLDTPASEIVFFEGDKFLLAGTTGWQRTDLKKYGPRMESAAFTYTIPRPLIEDLSKIRVFAVTEGQATELPISVGAP